MGIRPILALLAACTALFGISFAVGGLLKQDDDDASRTGSKSPSSKSASRLTAEEPSLALGRAAGLPDLRRKPQRAPEPAYAAANIGPPRAAPAHKPAPEPNSEPPPSVEPAPTPVAPAQPAPVQPQTPVTPTQPRSSAPDSAPAQPAPDAAPSGPSPSPDPYASGGFYDDGG